MSAILLWRRTYRQFPLVTLYFFSAWSFGIARFIAFKLGKDPYFYTYWISELAGAVTVSLALYEVFLRRLFIRFYNVRFYRNLFPAAAAVIFVLTIVTVLEAPDRRAAFLIATRGFDFARTSVLIFFVSLMALMGRQWKRYEFGIALGFGLQAAVALINAAVRASKHYQPSGLGTLELIAYDAACIIWLITFFKPEDPPPPPGDDHRISPETLREARQWEDALKDTLSPGKRLR